MTDHIKPCRLCETVPEIEPYHHGFRIYCGSQVDNVHHDFDIFGKDREEVIAEWNRVMR